MCCFTALGSVAALAQDALRPSISPSDLPYTIGVRYWFSEGSSAYAIDSSGLDPSLGNPTSVLAYEDQETQTPELHLRLKGDDGLFFKAFAGGGWISSGFLDDEDYYAGQTKFSDTYSSIRDSNLFYVNADAGQSFIARGAGGEFAFSPFLGGSIVNEDLHAFGLRCNPDDVGGANCGAPGDVTVPYNVNVISNDSTWYALRLGAEASARFYDSFTLSAEAAYLPFAYLENLDSHHLRPDLGPTPNSQDSGMGDGYQLEAALNWDVLPHVNIGGGVRYWSFHTDGKTEFFQAGAEVELNNFTSQRLGVFAEASYKFN